MNFRINSHERSELSPRAGVGEEMVALARSTRGTCRRSRRARDPSTARHAALRGVPVRRVCLVWGCIDA